jgi:hypothetical protein
MVVGLQHLNAHPPGEGFDGLVGDGITRNHGYKYVPQIVPAAGLHRRPFGLGGAPVVKARAMDAAPTSYRPSALAGWDTQN